ncbi:MAG: hypothetical protein GY708_01870 [Actinomycetia bacterium]|nr:hypothetical protein [Actinomycetes bacterium]MCP4960992.1 hypothetical protein [Actinomycetes bacterium]
MVTTRRVLVIGAGGYVGRHLVDSCAGSPSVELVSLVRPSSRTVPGALPMADAAALDNLLADQEFDQIVSLPQLTRSDVDWIVDRVDGSRWLVFSSSQLRSGTRAPGVEAALAREELVVSRGGVVLAPTMIFGRGGDANLSRIIRQMNRTRTRFQVGDGSQLVQPVHVDDVVSLVHAHRSSDVTAGVYPVGGAEAIPAAELMLMIAELLGVRLPPIPVPTGALRMFARFAPVAGLRPDQIDRLVEDKTVDDMITRVVFGWEPVPLAHRVEQAVGEVLAASSR